MAKAVPLALQDDEEIQKNLIMQTFYIRPISKYIGYKESFNVNGKLQFKPVINIEDLIL